MCIDHQSFVQAAAEKEEGKSKKSSSKKNEQIYIGQGRYVEDDPKKYPTKDSFGTGGWAGGEAGLQQWLEKGDAVRSLCHKAGLLQSC